MAEKVTTMVLKVDLQCPSCYKKIKKILCKFPQIKDQVYDEKQNTVTITVVCCSPEKIRDKLCCKGGKTIKSIEIKAPPKPKPDPPKPKPEPEKPKPQPEKPKPEPEKPKPQPEKPKPEPEKPKPEPEKPKPQPEKPKPEPEKPKPQPEKPKPEPEKPPVCYPPVFPIGVCCGPCYEGNPGGPCYHGYGRPMPCYDGCRCGCGFGYGYGGGHRDGYVSRCDDYFSEENASGCTIM